MELDTTLTQENTDWEDDRPLVLSGRDRFEYYQLLREPIARPLSKRKRSVWQRLLHLFS